MNRVQKDKEKHRELEKRCCFQWGRKSAIIEKKQKLSCSTFDKLISVIYPALRDAFSYVCTQDDSMIYQAQGSFKF